MLIKHQCPVLSCVCSVQCNIPYFSCESSKIGFQLDVCQSSTSSLLLFLYSSSSSPHRDTGILLLMVAGFLTSHPGWCCCHIQPLVPLLPPSQLKIKEQWRPQQRHQGQSWCQSQAWGCVPVLWPRSRPLLLPPPGLALQRLGLAGLCPTPPAPHDNSHLGVRRGHRL